MTFSEVHINRQARHEFWTERYREQRKREGRIALVCFLLVVALVMGLGMALDKPEEPDTQEPQARDVAVLPAQGYYLDSAVLATWDGARYSCPGGLSVYADEQDARAGKDFVYCVK